MKMMFLLSEQLACFLNGSRRRMFSLLALILVLCCAGLAIASNAYVAGKRRTVTLPLSTTAAPQAGPAHGPVQVVRFALYDVGIYPHEAHVGKGLIAITTEDLSGGSPGVIVEQAVGKSRVSVGSVQRAQHWRATSE